MNEDKINKSTWRKELFPSLLSLPIIGIVFILLFCCKSYSDKITFAQSVLIVMYAILLGGSAYLIGWFGGFLFGLPRQLANPEESNKSNYLRNDNLIQVSDWLTKIIVGLGLANLHKVPTYLALLGSGLGVLFYDKETGSIISQVIVVYFLISGFLFGYLWTNIQYIPILTEVDSDIQEILNESLRRYSIALEKGNVQSKGTDTAKLEAMKDVAKFAFVSDDPQKNQWGGKSELNDRKITATVVETLFRKGWFEINLTVESTSSRNLLENIVTFHLHNTFSPDVKKITPVDGKAKLQLFAYGAFTVGVEIQNEETKLELDLSALPDAPQLFKIS